MIFFYISIMEMIIELITGSKKIYKFRPYFCHLAVPLSPVWLHFDSEMQYFLSLQWTQHYNDIELNPPL